jgi:WD40 repeat protein
VLSPDGKTAVALGGLYLMGDPTPARVLDAATWSERGTLVGHAGHVTDAVFTPDGRLILTFGADRTIRIHDARSLAPVAIVPVAGVTPLYSPFAVTPDGSRLVVVANNTPEVQTGTLWDLPGPGAGVKAGSAVPELKPRRTLYETERSILAVLLTSVAVPPDGKLLAVVTFGQGASVVSVRDLTDGRERARLNVPGLLTGRAAFSPDGRRLAAAFLETRFSAEAALIVWETAGWQQVALVAHRPEDDPALGAPVAQANRLTTLLAAQTLAFSPDGSRLALSDRHGAVVFRDPATLDVLGVLRSHESAVTGLAFAPGGRVLVTSAAGEGEPVKVWGLAP